MNTFEDCTNLTSINVDPESGTYCSIDGVLMRKTETGLMLSKCPKGKKGGYSIPSSVTEIGEFAFAGCSGLTSVTIPPSVTKINGSASGCTSLTSINVDPESGAYCSIDGVLMMKTKTGLILLEYPEGKKGGYSIPTSVTKIGWSAFYGCTGLTSVTIPSSVTYIGSYAFKGCSGLTSVTIPPSVTKIGDSAFYGCSGLSSVTIPSSVTKIGDSAFYGCSGLSSVTIPSSVAKIGDSAFYGCSGLSSVTIEGKTEFENHVFYGCTLKPLWFKDEIYYSGYTFSGLNENSVIYAPESLAERIKKFYFPNTFAHD